MDKQHLKCEQLLKDVNAEYKCLLDSLNGLLSGTTTAEEVNATSETVFNRVDNLIDDYQSKH